jgi:hypothetical protein
MIGSMMSAILIVLFLLSCTDFRISHNSKQDTIKDIKYVHDSSNIKEGVIFRIVGRMDAGEPLSDVELDSLCTFIITNEDEGLAEGIGNALFRYYQRNNNRCEALKSRLIKNKRRSIIERRLIMYLCVDIRLEEYNQERLYKDFIFFEKNMVINNLLIDCLSN